MIVQLCRLLTPGRELMDRGAILDELPSLSVSADEGDLLHDCKVCDRGAGCSSDVRMEAALVPRPRGPFVTSSLGE
jgi:hypothetical protein